MGRILNWRHRVYNINMNFENKVVSFTPKPLFEDREFVDVLKLKRLEVLKNKPKEDDFSDIYGQEEVNKDKKDIEELKSKWENITEEEKYLKDISDIYEAMIADQIGNSEWFGKNCKSFPSSTYDDIKNGIDVVNVFKNKELFQYMGLGVDVCFSSKKDELEKKLESIKQCIRSGDMPTLKYFKDLETGEKKKILLPKVIVGSRLSSAEKLIRTWGRSGPNREKEMKENPIQSKLILETITQLRYFYNFAKRLSEGTREIDMSQKYEKISIEYAKMYNLFYDIYEEKKSLIDGHLNEISDDIVYETIIEYTNK